MKILAGEDNKAPERVRNVKDYLVQALIFIAVIALGIFAVNQTLEYYYKAELLKTPCDLCKELNPGVASCLSNSKEIRYNNIKINLTLIEFSNP